MLAQDTSSKLTWLSNESICLAVKLDNVFVEIAEQQLKVPIFKESVAQSGHAREGAPDLSVC